MKEVAEMEEEVDSSYSSTETTTANKTNAGRNSKHKTINNDTVATTTEGCTFPIPASLQDLERDPYNLLPYPDSFDADADDDERADAFQNLVDQLQEGNDLLANDGMALFYNNSTNDGMIEVAYNEPWMGHNRIQALYTLVRWVRLFVLGSSFYLLTDCQLTLSQLSCDLPRGTTILQQYMKSINFTTT